MNIRPNWRRSFGLVTFDPDPWEMTLAANRVQDNSYEKYGLIPRMIRGYSYEFWGFHNTSDSESDSDNSYVVRNPFVFTQDWSPVGWQTMDSD